VTDLALQRGYGIFDFFKTKDHKAIFLDDHLDRFFHSAEKMRLSTGKTRDQLKALLAELMKRNNIADSGIKITLTGGYSPDGYMLSGPNLIIIQTPLVLAKEMNTTGISLITHPHQRQLPDVKTTDYLMAIWLQPLIKAKGADDVLYHNGGIIGECPRANFFIVTKENELLTPSSNILKGIVRKHILDIYREEGPVFEKDITLQDVKECKEAFITSSTKNVLPVTMIDGKPVGSGYPGEVSQWLWERIQLRISQTI
jgi:D-alanine transaminase/branched-chain amino acid aminotransferase